MAREELTTEDYNDIIERLQDIYKSFSDALGELDEIVNRELKDANADAYLVEALKNHIEGGNPYDLNMPSFIKRVENMRDKTGEYEEPEELLEEGDKSYASALGEIKSIIRRAKIRRR